MNPNARISYLGLPTRPSEGKGRRGGRIPHSSSQALNNSLAGSNLLDFLPLLCSPAQTSINGLNKETQNTLLAKTEQALSSLILAGSSLSGTLSRGRIFTTQGCGSRKHHLEIVNWERGDQNQAKEMRTLCL